MMDRRPLGFSRSFASTARIRFAVALSMFAAATNMAGAAESLGVLPVALPPGPPAHLVELAADLRSHLADRAPGVLDAAQLRERMIGPSPASSIPELERACEGARQSYRQGDVAGSVRTLRTVVAEIEKLPDGPEAFALWQQVMLRLAREELDLGRADVAGAVADELVHAAPQVQVDPDRFPPRMVSLVAEARARAALGPLRTLVVTSTVPGARIYVSGRDVGEAPATLHLPPGRYRVSGVIDGTRSPPTAVDLLQDDASVTLDFAIPASLRPALGPGLALPDVDRGRWIIAIGGFLRLDFVLAASLVEDQGTTYLSGAMFDVRRGTLTREGRIRVAQQGLPAGGSAALAEFLVTGKASSALVEVLDPLRPGMLATTPAATQGNQRLTEGSAPPPTSVLGWTAFGTGIAAVGLAGVSIWQAIASSNSYASAAALRLPDGSVPPSQLAYYDQLLASGDSSRTAAIATGIAAGACAVGTVVLAIITGELGPIRF